MIVSVPVLIFSIAIIVLSVLMIVVVAAQTKRGEGMGGAVTGQNNFGNGARKDGKDVFLKRITIIFGILFIVAVVVFDILLSTGVIK